MARNTRHKGQSPEIRAFLQRPGINFENLDILEPAPATDTNRTELASRRLNPGNGL